MHSSPQLGSGARPVRALRWTAWIVLAAISVGCGQPRAPSDYVPAPVQARQAVEQMLEAWRSGDTAKPEFQFSGNGPRVQVFDKERASGRKLAKFEVVRELPEEPNRPRQIAVKLIFDGNNAEVEATYHVVGIDPLLIFRDSEYKQASGMN